MTCAVKAPSSPEAPSKVATRLFGVLELASLDRFHFPKGFPGFPAATDFALLPAAPRGLAWLQSLNDESLAFLLVEPTVIAPHYSIADASRVELGRRECYAVVTLPRQPGATAYANLRAPVLLNRTDRSGLQLLLDNPEWDFRYPFDLGPVINGSSSNGSSR